MADFKAVNVQDVHVENVESAWPALLQAINNCEFLAMDLELSGLGNRRQLMAYSVEERYKTLATTVRTRAVIAVGLSCFRRLNPSLDEVGERWIAQTFDISTLCSENYTVEPGALKFLIDHGFDFNKQYAKGLPYKRGNDQGVEPEKSIRSLISLIFTSGRPLVMHNAMVDLAFLYGSFYADLPNTFDQFIADTSVMFASGLYDTKVISEYHMRLPASYLQYVFRHSQRRNYKDSVAGRRHISLIFLSPVLSANIDTIKCKLRSSFTAASQRSGAASTEAAVQKSDICEKFAAYGFCHLNNSCPKSHDLDDILDVEDAEIAKKSRKRRQRAERKAAARSGTNGSAETHLSEGEVSSSDGDEADSDDSEPPAKKICKSPAESSSGTGTQKVAVAKPGPANVAASASLSSKPIRKWCTGSHRAGFDAFMTGFYLAYCLRQNAPKTKATGGDCVSSELFAPIWEHRNRINLSGKDKPMQLVKSHFAKTSQQHNEKWAKLVSKT
eukprot:scpid40792/ scgid33851/ Target of EGR1 protein 1